MKNSICLTLFALVSISIAPPVFADSLRCNTKLALVGDTKAEIIDKCGEPVMTDSFCQPIAANTQAQGVQVGNNNVQNNIAIAACENVDIWTYHPGSGKFKAHLYFARGQLQSVRYGDRVK